MIHKQVPAGAPHVSVPVLAPRQQVHRSVWAAHDAGKEVVALTGNYCSIGSLIVLELGASHQWSSAVNIEWHSTVDGSHVLTQVWSNEDCVILRTGATV